MGHPLLVASAAGRVERVLQLLHLSGCADTLLGGGAVRGVSGGERKRVSVAEALVSNARLLCLDEISTGLDASVTYDILASVAAWAAAMRGTVAVSLQQPTPEVFALFHDVALLREGQTVYHGAREALSGYLGGLGYAVPQAAQGGADVADFLLELLSSPANVLAKQPGGAGAAPRSTAALAAAWAAAAPTVAPPPKTTDAEADAPPPGLALASPFARAQYGQAFPRPAASVFASLLWRQAVLTSRNRTVVLTRIFATGVQSIIMGLLWFNLGVNQGGAKLGMLVSQLRSLQDAPGKPR
jgi:hypothetical protein